MYNADNIPYLIYHKITTSGDITLLGYQEDKDNLTEWENIKNHYGNDVTSAEDLAIVSLLKRLENLQNKYKSATILIDLVSQFGNIEALDELELIGLTYKKDDPYSDLKGWEVQIKNIQNKIEIYSNEKSNEVKEDFNPTLFLADLEHVTGQTYRYNEITLAEVLARSVVAKKVQENGKRGQN